MLILELYHKKNTCQGIWKNILLSVNSDLTIQYYVSDRILRNRYRLVTEVFISEFQQKTDLNAYRRPCSLGFDIDRTLLDIRAQSRGRRTSII